MPQQTIHRLVEHQAGATPDAPAVSTEAEELSFDQLNRRANRLARLLRETGVGVESRVGVALPRSPSAIVAFLAVLKAGGVYVPLDPDYPDERLAFMLDDSGVTAVIGSSGSLRQFERPGLALLTIDEVPPPAADESNLDIEVPDNACAYVVYTSGSTGVPKGVMVAHRHVVALVANDSRLAVAAGDTVAHFAPTAFDASTFEVWAALCRGGRVAVFPPGGGVSLVELGRLLRLWRPDWLFLTTGLFHLLADFDRAALGSVGRLLTGGDVLAPHHILSAAEVTTVFAAYGPTETTVFASLHEVMGTASETERVPLGTPLKGMDFHVLTARLDPVPDGEIGELFISGSGVARGYQGRPGLTAERFLPHPHGAPGQRLYRTGDLARRLPDGRFEFHGRADRQVKVRGFRIELGEVESLLSGCPQVSACAVVAVPGVDSDKRLAAFVALRPGEDIAVSELRAYAMRRLPAHAVPATFVVLDRLPLDTNGKVDRNALPDPWASRDGLHGLPPFVPPRTELERVISVAWAEALELDQVGMDDEFFALGGDSLRSVSVLERLRGLGIRFSAGEFFSHPTVADLAGLAEKSVAGSHAYP